MNQESTTPGCCSRIKSKKDLSILLWGAYGLIGISTAFYLVQVLGMQSWSAPFYFMIDKWYFVIPLVLSFAIQMSFFRAIHLLKTHGGGGAMIASGGVSTGSMLACCAHNLVFIFPALGLTGFAAITAAYQTQIFLVSIIITYAAVGYVWYKYSIISHK